MLEFKSRNQTRGTKFYGTAIQRNAIQLHSRGLSLVQNQFCNKRKMHGVYVCKLLNVFWKIFFGRYGAFREIKCSSMMVNKININNINVNSVSIQKLELYLKGILM